MHITYTILRPLCLFIGHGFILLVAIFIGLSASLNAQSILVNGKIITEDNIPIIGATILEVNTTNGCVSDDLGNFTLKVNSLQATLSVEYFGYEKKEIALDGNATINIILEESIKVLQDVVVTGYRKESKSNVTTAISSINPKKLENLLLTGLDQALQGQASGVSVTQVTGSPGDDIAIRIRGVTTLGNNNPLFIIDGVPTTGNINMFSMNDIASIDVLKDGAAAAIYGARAANGVVVITTKRGKSGKPTFSFNAYTGVQSAQYLPKLLNASEYLMIRNEAITNANSLRNPANQLPLYDMAILDTLPDINWLDRVFQSSPMRQISFSSTVGSDNSSLFISGEYFNQDGIFKGQAFDKYQLRINGDVGNKFIKVGTNFSFSNTDRKVINGSGDGFGPGNELSGIRYALITSPVFSGVNKDGSPINVTSLLGDPTLYGDGNANPEVFIKNTDWTINRSRIFGNVFVELTPIKKLKLKTSLGGDLLFEKNKLFKERLSAAIYSPTSLNEGRVFNQTLIWNTTADYDLKIGKHGIVLLAGMEAITNNTDYLGASASNFRRSDPLFRYINASVPTELNDVGGSGIATEWALLSYFGNGSYNYNNKYLFSSSLRLDGSSRFGKGNRWALFPSFSGAWIISNEDFLKSNDVISELKLRGSWGRLGNQEIGVYPYSSLVSIGNRVYTFGDNIATGAYLVESGNSNIKWESTTQTNIGLDVALFKDRVNVAIDVFEKISSDILVRVPIPQSGGAGNPPYVNAASIENKGIELSLGYRNNWKALKWNVSGNISALKNKVLSIANSEPILGGFGLSDGPLTKTEVDRPIGSFYLWQMEGIFQSQAEIDAAAFQTKDTRPGDVKFADINNDKIIDDKDRNHVGDPFPDFTYGMQFGFNLHNFDFSTQLQGVQGNDVYFLYGNFAYDTQLRGFNSYADILNRWTPTNTNTNVPKVSLDDRNGNRRSSTRFLYDGSYMRIKNISLGYTIKSNKTWMKDKSMRIYASIQNAFTFTNYPGLDPEIQANANDTRGLGLSSDLAVGIDWGTVPSPRTYTMGIKLDF
ncbi:MAG: hypothetical protein RLZZ546_2438 [Bacteroidota bacterium]|jgi:TonB-linked SusC/RagA family outer membrane protein